MSAVAYDCLQCPPVNQCAHPQVRELEDEIQRKEEELQVYKTQAASSAHETSTTLPEPPMAVDSTTSIADIGNVALPKAGSLVTGSTSESENDLVFDVASASREQLVGRVHALEAKLSENEEEYASKVQLFVSEVEKMQAVSMFTY